MGVLFHSYVIWKRLELETSAWSRFLEILKLFKMLMDFKYKVCVVFNKSYNTERPVFILAIVTLWEQRSWHLKKHIFLASLVTDSLFSRVLRDSMNHYVGRSVCRSVRRSVGLH